jgi:Flp pilus assembly protein TadG
MSAKRRLSRRGRGQGLAEFALVIPIFLVVFLAVFDLGGVVFAYNSITNAAREGARLAVVDQDTTRVTQRAVQQAAIARSPTVTVAYYVAASDGTPDTSKTCPVGATTYIAVGCLAVVTFTGTYTPITPVIGNIVFKNGVTFTAKSVLPVEYTCPDGSHTAAQCLKQP